MITINLKNYDEFTRKVGQLVVNKAINTWIEKSLKLFQEKVQKEQIEQKVEDKWVLFSSYVTKTKKSALFWELYNTRLYWLFQHEWYTQWVWWRNTWEFKEWRPWFTDAVNENRTIPEDTIWEEINKTIKKILW